MTNDLMAAGIAVIPVEIKNSADLLVKPKYVHHTTTATYALDPTAVIGVDSEVRQVQICAYEPNRVRMLVIAQDAAIAITTDPPRQSPDPNTTVGTAPQGGRLPATPIPYEFFGPDAFWVNVLDVPTRVTVIKEYCILP